MGRNVPDGTAVTETLALLIFTAKHCRRYVRL